MKIIIKTKNIEPNGELNKFIEKKFFGLKKFVNILKTKDELGKKTLAEVFVEVGKETMHHKKGEIFVIKSRVYLPSREIIARAKEKDLFSAVTEARDELKMEIEKYKFKKIDKNRREQRKSKKEINL